MSIIWAIVWRLLPSFVLSAFLCLSFSTKTFAEDQVTTSKNVADKDAKDAKSEVKRPDGVSAAWSEVPLDQRCEGLLAFMRAMTAVDLKDWALTKPQCLVAGDASGSVSWSLDAAWQKGSKALPLRYQIHESITQKPKAIWCIVKGKNFGCAAPWDAAFSQGKLYQTPAAAKAAYDGVMMISQGFLSLATKLDEWAGKKAQGTKIFDLTYTDYVKAWVQSTRSLPVTGGIAVADYKPDGDGALTGTVRFNGDIPMSLRQCLGCGKSDCAKSVVAFSFSGLGLTFTRQLLPDEQKGGKVKSASVSWIMMEPTPFSGGEAKWPFLCGEHRFNVQKL